MFYPVQRPAVSDKLRGVKGPSGNFRHVFEQVSKCKSLGMKKEPRKMSASPF
jgi:hypothetical protein